MSNLWSILFGAVIASIIPIMTLILNNSRWKKEKRVEHLRLKHERLERIYLEINEALPDSVLNNSYPSSITSKIFTFGSTDVQKTFTVHIANKKRTEQESKEFIFDMAKKANEHLISIEKRIENILS